MKIYLSKMDDDAIFHPITDNFCDQYFKIKKQKRILKSRVKTKNQAPICRPILFIILMITN